jgi:hypothetical protein
MLQSSRRATPKAWVAGTGPAMTTLMDFGPTVAQALLVVQN